MRRPVAMVALVLGACLGAAGMCRDSDVLADGHPASFAAAPGAYWEATVDGYSAEDRQLLQGALDSSLRDLRDRGSELEVAAAVNAYLHQYLLNEPADGNGVAILRAQHAACGGAANTMQEMLYLAGIKSRPAALLGVPYQGNHALVEVQFSDGQRGLFDPTFGVFFYDTRARRPVSMTELLHQPQLAATTLMKSRFEKRRSTRTGVVAITSIADAYRLRRNYRELAKHPGDAQMDWPLGFRIRLGGGVGATGKDTIVLIRLRAGHLYGSLRPPADAAPWTPLALAKDAGGRSFPWAHVIGASGAFQVAHRYRISGLRRGHKYRLTLVYAVAQRFRYQARRSAASRPFADLPVPDLPYIAGSGQKASVSVTFTAHGGVDNLWGRTSDGYARFQAIQVKPVAAGRSQGRGSMRRGR